MGGVRCLGLFPKKIDFFVCLPLYLHAGGSLQLLKHTTFLSCDQPSRWVDFWFSILVLLNGQAGPVDLVLLSEKMQHFYFTFTTGLTIIALETFWRLSDLTYAAVI